MGSMPEDWKALYLAAFHLIQVTKQCYTLSTELTVVHRQKSFCWLLKVVLF